MVAFNESGVALPITPCGACRQALIEFGKGAEVGFLNSDNEWMTVTANDLLPHRLNFRRWIETSVILHHRMPGFGEKQPAFDTAPV